MADDAGDSSTRFSLIRWFRGLLASERRELTRIRGEFSAMRGLMPLLMKARNGQTWTAEEKTQLLRQLRQLSHLSPYLLLLMLPGSVLLLPAYAWWLDRRRIRREKHRATGPL